MSEPGPAPRSEIVLYQTSDGQTRIDVRMVDETVWLSLDQMAELFQRDKSTVSRHVSNVFSESGRELLQILQQFRSKVPGGSLGRSRTTTWTRSSRSGTG